MKLEESIPSKKVDTCGLHFDDAKLLVNYIEKHATEVVTLCELRQDKLCDYVIFNLRTGRPQSAADLIRPIEKLAVRFGPLGFMPIVLVLRSDFPVTSARLISDEGAPPAICIDTRSWAEIQLDWTPANFISRIVDWFNRAANDELQDAGQPLDPVLSASGFKVIVPRDLLDPKLSLNLYGHFVNDNLKFIRIGQLESGQIKQSDKIQTLFNVVSLSPPPQKITQIASQPRNLKSLSTFLSKYGMDLNFCLREKISNSINENSPSYPLLNSRMAIFIELKVQRSKGSIQNGVDHRVFVTKHTAGEIGEALGVTFKNSEIDADKSKFVRKIKQSSIDESKMKNFNIAAGEVHYELDQEFAARLSNQTKVDKSNTVLVGAGALGSQFANCLSREGLFNWTIIDHDIVLPHNLAKHIARREDVGFNKAEILANAINSTVLDQKQLAQHYPKTLNTSIIKVANILKKASLIIDASACPSTGRSLSDFDTNARIASIFFNPRIDSAILLLQPKSKNISLRNLEGLYYSHLARKNEPKDHFASPDEMYVYTGACNALTNLTPESRIQILSGLLALGVKNALKRNGATIKIWKLSHDGTVKVNNIESCAVHDIKRKDWTISYDENLINRLIQKRAKGLPNEVGGVLIGVVDQKSKYIQLVDACDPPSDSKSGKTEFERGTCGLEEQLGKFENRTNGHVKYVGEWHTHPKDIPPNPSLTDLIQYVDLATAAEIEGRPPIMLIGGENEIKIYDNQSKPISIKFKSLSNSRSNS